MKIDVRARSFGLTDGLREHVKHRLQFTLTRFQERVERICVYLSDINGPRGGVDKECHLEVHLRGLPTLVVKDRQADLYVAIDRASQRAGRSLQRSAQRAQEDVHTHF